MDRIISRYKVLWLNKSFLNLAFDGTFFLIVSLILNYYAGTYASIRASNSVNDFFLDNLPTYNVNFIFINGFILFIALTAALLLNQPKKIPFTLKTVSLFIICRAIFMTLTHIGLPPEHSLLETGDVIGKFIFSGDLFFSGHVGLSFLMALIFWPSLRIRMLFVAISIIFGISALLGHLHYSIDVFAAYFITHSIYTISKKLFAREYEILANNKLIV